MGTIPWLEDMNKDTVYCYKNTDTGEIVRGKKADLEVDFFGCDIECNSGEEVYLEGVAYEYAGFEPREYNLAHRITFEKNGRKGLRTRLGNGKTFTRSATKEKYMQGKGTNSVLTKACADKTTELKKEKVMAKYESTKKDIARQAHVLKEAKKGRRST